MENTPAQGDAQVSAINPQAVPASAPAPELQPAPAPVAPAPAPAPVPVAPAPQPASDRTSEQFEKLLMSNQKLYQANELLRKELSDRAMASQQFAPINQPPVQQPRPAQVSPQDFIEVDPVTNERYVNEDKLQAKIEELNRKATQAQEAITRYMQVSEEREAERQSREAYRVFPELDPHSVEFDVAFSNQVRAQIYDSLINPQDYGGRPLSFKDAAEFVTSASKRGSRAPAVQPAPAHQPSPAVVGTGAPAGVDQAMLDQAQAIKAQAAASAQGQPQPQRQTQFDNVDRAALVRATREGSQEALARRLAMTDHTRKDQADIS